jgi:hypothetical protein
VINSAGIYILVLLLTTSSGASVAMQEFRSFDACKAAITQLAVDRRLTGYCIAKDLRR